MLTSANAAGTNSLTCLPKHGGARDNKFWTPINDWRLRSLHSFRVQTLSALTARPSSPSRYTGPILVYVFKSIISISDYEPCQPMVEGNSATFVLDLQDPYKCGVTRVLNKLTVSYLIKLKTKETDCHTVTINNKFPHSHQLSSPNLVSLRTCVIDTR
jgi:hypothetical protein